MLWLAAFFLTCFGAAIIKPEGKSKMELTLGRFIGGGILCGLGIVCSVVDTVQDGGSASWMMLGVVVIMTSLAIFFRLQATLRKKS